MEIPNQTQLLTLMLPGAPNEFVVYRYYVLSAASVKIFSIEPYLSSYCEEEQSL
jgi:hypothetical protein